MEMHSVRLKKKKRIPTQRSTDPFYKSKKQSYMSCRTPNSPVNLLLTYLKGISAASCINVSCPWHGRLASLEDA